MNSRRGAGAGALRRGRLPLGVVPSLAMQQQELMQSRDAESRLRQEIGKLEAEMARLKAAMIDLLRRGER